MSLRELHTDVKGSLLKGDSFVYAHLVKFERVLQTQTSKPPETATDYSYITDASIDIVWDDGSKDVADTANGSQTYIANRLLKVGGINETTEAKATNLNLTVSSVALGSSFVSSQTDRLSLTVTGSNYPYPATASFVDSDVDDWVERGFSEGDKISISGSGANQGWDGIDLVINTFSNSNKQASCTIVGKTKPTANISGWPINVDLSTDEVVAILNNPNDTTYAGYINREVFIYKTHINPDTGAIIGNPYLIFKGIIGKAKLQEDPGKDSKINWTLTSHWGDFVRVNGRRTSDSDHRAISSNGSSDPSSLHRNEYAGDLGFMHSETAVNIIAIYQVMETRYKMKSSGLFGMKKKMVEYQVEVDRDVDLRINLEAKYLPVVYGVNRVDSIPIFADSLANDAATIYCVYAICEGEVSGIYDIYVDDQSRICIDKNDNDTRATQTSDKTIDVICEGRMDRGDTLSSSATSSRAVGLNEGISYSSYGRYGGPLIGYYWGRNYGRNTSSVAENVNSDSGVSHEKQTELEYPIKSTLQFHAGRPFQRSNDMLTGIAAGGKGTGTAGFKLQGDISDDKEKYWTPSHRLLDTAYVVGEFTIAEGDVNIPQLDFVIRGKEIEQYNYDYSYRVAPNVTTTAAAGLRTDHYKIGDKVDFYKGTDTSPFIQNIQIVDLTKYIDSREEEVWKYRFASNPLINHSSTTAFKMVVSGEARDHESAYWMVTWDHKTLSHNGLSKTLVKTVTPTADDGNATIEDNDSGGVDVTQIDQELQDWIDYVKSLGGITFSIMGSDYTLTEEDIMNLVAAIQLDSTGTNPTVVTNSGNTEITGAGSGSIDTSMPYKLFLTNAMYIGDADGTSGSQTASSVDDYYKGQILKVTQTLKTGDIKTQTREIIKYDGTKKVVYTGAYGPAEENANEVGTYTVASYAPWPAKFVTLNTVANLAVGQRIVRKSESPLPQSWVEAGAKITQIDVSEKRIHLSHSGNYIINSTLTAIGSTNKEFYVATPAPFDLLPLGTDEEDSNYPRNTKWEIMPIGDTKCSINPAAQLLDYLTSERYGKGLDIDKDIDIPSFQEVMRLCDTRADVTLILPDSGTYTIGDEWHQTNTIDSVPYLQWQGTIKSVYAINQTSRGTTSSYSAYTQVTFTNCIGKIVHKWFDWKTYNKGELLYHRIGEVNKVYMVSAPGAIDAPSGGNLSSVEITKVGTSTSVNVFMGANPSAGTTARESSWDHNPIVKEWDIDEDNFSITGYSLYDCDDVKYWRYLGWQEHNQREVTRHQTNAVIRTETALFDNVNSMLEHFNGILRYANGKYELDIKTQAPTSLPSNITYDSVSYIDPRRIHTDDIIGTITVDDAGLKGSANTVEVGISDPAIRYDKRTVSFYKSDYLKEDRGIPKKKSVKTPLITNYYNARLNAEQYLIDSRYARKISFQLGPQGVLLLAGSVIYITYPRFGWTDKAFRISNLQVREDCLIQVTAEEHEDSVYKIGGKKKQLGGTEHSTSPGGGWLGDGQSPACPTGLAVTGQNNAVELAWDNSGTFGVESVARSGSPITWATVLYRHTSSNFSSGTGASPLTVIPIGSADTLASSYKDSLPNITSDTTHYYWIKHIRNGRSSVIHPTAANGVDAGTGVAGTAISAAGSTGILYLYKSSINEPTDDPSDDSVFPTVTVSLSGANAGKITGVASGQSSAALTNNQIIDTAGNGTGWYIEPVDATDGDHVIWVVAATGSSAGATDEIARAEWTEPVKWSGGQGLNAATVILYQLTNSSSAPNDPNGDLTYTFATGVVSGNHFNSWSTAASSTAANNQYLWRITAAAIGRKDTHTIPAADWATAVIHSQYGVGAAGSDAKAVKLTANKYAIAFAQDGTESDTLTFTAAPQGLEGTGTYKFDVDAGSGFVEKQAASTTATYAMADSDEPTSGDAHVVKVTMYDGGTAVATDSVSVYGVQDGSDALTVIFPNEAHVLPASNAGAVSSYTGSGTDIRIYKGATLLTAATSGTTVNTFKATSSASSITASSSTGSVVSVLGTNDTLRYAAHSAMANSSDTASITYTITAYTAAGTTTITKIQSFTKSKTGSTPTVEDGNDAPRIVTGYVYWQGLKTTTSGHTLPSSTFTFGGALTNASFNADLGGGTPGQTDTSNPHNNWTISPPVADSTRSKVYYAPFTATETITNGNATDAGNVVYGSVQEGISFTGLVTFNSTTDQFEDGGTAITQIDGGTIKTGSITANRLSIGNQAVGGSTSTLKLYSDALKIFDGGDLRVKLGNLGNTTDE